MIKVFLKAYSSLLFSNSFYLGFLLFLLSFINPSVAISGAISILATLFFSHLIKINNTKLFQGFYIYNSLLLGMSMGYLYLPSVTMLLTVVLLAIVTFLFSLFLSKVMAKKSLPILSVPFMLVSLALYFFSLNYPSLLPFTLSHEMLFDIELPLLLSALFKSIGSIFFLPNNLIGLAILLFLLFHSRILFLLTLLGFYWGVLFHALLLNSLTEALLNIYAFNYIITAFALGAIFLLPTIKNFLLTLLAVSLTVLVAHVMNQSIDYYLLTLPFNLIVTFFLFMLYFLKYKGFNYFPLSTPEASLHQYLGDLKRFEPSKIQLILPFSGEWQVYQAFNGEWTHKDEWQHAYDFVINKHGSTYKNSGNFVEDYHCYGQAVLSPVNGTVVACNDELFDNPIGFVNEEHNWGNYLVLQTYDGFFIEISHLMQYSLKVQVGDKIEVHTPLAKCGNSGYSAQPHIHIQVQESALLGSTTLPFCFYESVHKNQLSFHTLPKLSERISPLAVNQSINQKFTYVENESFHYEVYKNKKFIEDFTFTVKINDKYESYFEDKDTNQLFFYKTQTQFYLYRYNGKESYLQYMFELMPRIPLTQNSVTYEDTLPYNLFYKGLKKVSSQILMFISPHKHMKLILYTWENNILSSIQGRIIFSNDSKSFNYLQYDTLELKSK